VTTTNPSPIADFDDEDVEDFILGYVEAWLRYETLPPPSGNEKWQVGATYEQADFDADDFTKESRQRLWAHARAFLERGADLITDNALNSETCDMEHAGYDAALGCQGLDEAFAADRWKRAPGKKLARIAEALPALSIEPSGGKLHVS
jgi:hypothetical protein